MNHDPATLRAINYLRDKGLETALEEAQWAGGPLSDEEEMAYLTLEHAAKNKEIR